MSTRIRPLLLFLSLASALLRCRTVPSSARRPLLAGCLLGILSLSQLALLRADLAPSPFSTELQQQAATQGQAKFYARQAYSYLETAFIGLGGSGNYIPQMIQSDWFTSQTHDHQALQLGQLKTLAKPFYDQLNAMGHSTLGILHYTSQSIYPWPDSSEQDQSGVTLGQLNFAFSLTNTDSDSDGLPDPWELHWFGDQNNGEASQPDADPDGDGLSNYNEYITGTNPNSNADANSNGMPDDWELFWSDQFAVYPAKLTATLSHQATTTQTLYLNNPVAPDADFTITLSNHQAGDQVTYSANDSLTGTASYNWTDISTTGTVLTDISEHDNSFQTIALTNFTFPFYGSRYDELHIGSNGIVTFAAGTTDSGNDPIPRSYGPNAFIALFWDDLDTNDARSGDGGIVYYQQLSDRLIIQYQDVMRDADSDKNTQSNTFQAILHASGLIEVFYKSMGGVLTSASIGIENQSASEGIQVAYNSAYLQDNLAVRYEPSPLYFLATTPSSGTVAAASSSEIDLSFNSHDLAPGNYQANIEINHTGSGTSTWTIPAEFIVNNPPAEISITQPDNGTHYWMDEDADIYVTASDADFGIERVTFYAGDELIGEDTTAAYRLDNWTPDTPGIYQMTARAVDQFGTETVSSPIQITFREDTDLDRMEDSWERLHFGSLSQAASADFDGDGMPNVFEYHHGTDPSDTNSQLTFSEDQANAAHKYYIVDATAPNNHPYKKQTIRSAIYSANDYDVIEVRPGSYQEAFGTIYDRIYLFSTAGARNTRIELTGLNSRAFYLRSESVISGLTFAGANPDSPNFDGGAAYIYISSEQNQPRFIACRFINNVVGDQGGALYVSRGNPLFISCTVAGNQAATGNAIYSARSSNQISLINTLLWNPGPSTEIAGYPNTVSFDHALTRDANSGKVLIDGVDQATSNPGLSFDFSLTADSVARNAGTLSLYAPLDLDGESLTDGLKDIGADEFTDSDSDQLPDWIEQLAGGELSSSADYDGDSLSNLTDYNAGANPLSNDTDADGLLDGDELYSNGSHGDTDGFITSVNNADTDGDGLNDGWEVAYGLNPTSFNTPETDSDGDGLTDEQEFSVGGNPLVADTDSDGMPDLYEFTYELNLNFDDSLLDSDSDGLSNLQEYQLGTRPDYFDTDGDLLPDGWELEYRLDLLTINSIDSDTDGDGLDLFDEYLNGTDPFTADSDGDGTLDGAEVTQGSDPGNHVDGGHPPAPETTQEVEFAVGDPSGSHSERWEMTITGLGPDTRVMRLSNRTFGTMTPNKAYKLRKDSDYKMTLSHLATNQTENGPDYDWQAQVEGQPSTLVLASGVTHSDANRFRVIHNHWILDNEDGLFGRVNQGFYDTNHATGKSATLLKVDFEFQNSKMSDWKNVKPDQSVVTRVGVIRGDEVDFRIADAASLPASQLTWSGEQDGTGASISITFDELGEQEVILEIADTEIARAIVTVAEPTGVNEAGWILAHPSVLGSIQGIRDEAEEWVQDNLDALGGGWTNGPGDAARHAYWSGLMALFWGHDYSEGLGTAHEVTGLQSQNADHNSTVMDLENNAVGRSLASPGMTIDQLRQAVTNSLNGGDLTILDEIANPQERGLLQPSNQ